MTTQNNPSTSTAPAPPVTQDWVRFRSIAYLTGRGLAFGVRDDIFPRVATAPGKFSLNTDILPNPNIAVCDGRLDIFQDGVFDHVVIGPSLGMCPNPGSMVREIASKLRKNGHLVMYLNKTFTAPGVRFQFNESAMMEMVESAGAWRVKAQITRGDDMLLVVKKIAGTRGTIVPAPERAAKRACIVRYGALGDMVMITPLIRKLAEDGYEVTMNITPYAAPVVENNPYITNIVIQEREAIPNRDLGRYWSEWAGEYDRYINLSESIEGKLLKVENRRDYFTTQEWRKKVCGSTNYYDQTMALGGYPDLLGTRGELFFTPAERKEALRFRKEHEGKTIIGWAVNGSSHHKRYPLAPYVVSEWMEKHPNTVFVLLGGPEAKEHSFDGPGVENTVGSWGLRQTMAFIAIAADVMIGPESMALNVAACYDRPKITFLSHSNPENLCKYWVNSYPMEPDTDIAPCYPCHQLHYTMDSCPIGDLRDRNSDGIFASGPVCAMGAISGNRVLDTLELAVASLTPEDSPVAV